MYCTVTHRHSVKGLTWCKDKYMVRGWAWRSYGLIQSCLCIICYGCRLHRSAGISVWGDCCTPPPPPSHPHPISQLILVEIQQSHHCIDLLSTPWWRGYTVRKGYRFSRPQRGCHLPYSFWVGIIKLFPCHGEFGKLHPGWGRKYRSPFFYSVFSYYSFADLPFSLMNGRTRGGGGRGASYSLGSLISPSHEKCLRIYLRSLWSLGEESLRFIKDLRLAG